MRAAYLRVRLDGEGARPAVRAVQLRTRAPGEVPQLQWLEARFVRQDERGAYVYRSPARVPAEQLDVRLGADNAVAHFTLHSREREAQGWRPQGSSPRSACRGRGWSW